MSTVWTVIAAPYHLGRRGYGVGAGPEALVRAGVPHGSVLWVADPTAPFEVARTFEVARGVAGLVAGARTARPLVLAGECTTALGTLAGLGAQHRAVVWFDAHADLNTPESSPSGFLDGMALALVTGRCWSALCRSLPGWAAVAGGHVLLAGARAFDPPERAALERAQIRHVAPGPGWRASLAQTLDALAGRVTCAYLHVDLDVLDVGEARANAWSCAGGITLAELEHAIDAVARRFRVDAAALTAFDPGQDTGGRSFQAARAVVDALARALATAPAMPA